MAQLVVIVAGRTQGIRWELEHIFGKGQQDKLVIFFPPQMRRNSQQRV
jgi:hypothetical protein